MAEAHRPSGELALALFGQFRRSLNTNPVAFPHKVCEAMYAHQWVRPSWAPPKPTAKTPQAATTSTTTTAADGDTVMRDKTPQPDEPEVSPTLTIDNVDALVGYLEDHPEIHMVGVTAQTEQGRTVNALSLRGAIQLLAMSGTVESLPRAATLVDQLARVVHRHPDVRPVPQPSPARTTLIDWTEEGVSEFVAQYFA